MKPSLTSDSRVLVIGAVVIDKVVHVDSLPKTGEDVYGSLEKIMVGGCAFNVQQIMEHLGISNILFAPVGKGSYSQIIRNEFKNLEISVMLEDNSNDNGWNISFVEKNGERTFLTIPGIETEWKKEWFYSINLREFDFIYLSGYELEWLSGEVLVEKILKQKSTETKVVFDPGPRVSFIDKTVLESLLKAGTIVHCNESEITALYPGEQLENAARKLQDVTGETVVVTLGGKGCFYLENDRRSGNVAAEQVTVVDTIGAGDAHTGAFISGLARGFSIKDACKLANEISAEVVQKSGGRL